jgi:hypothetical protein
MLWNKIPNICFYYRPWNRIPSCFLFYGMVRNRIPRVCFYFCSTVQNSCIFLFRGMVGNGILRVSPSFVPRYKFREFSVLRSSLNSIGTTDLFRQLRLTRNYFCRKFPIKLIWTISHWNSLSSKCCIKTIYRTVTHFGYLKCSICLLHTVTSCGSNVDDAIFS